MALTTIVRSARIHEYDKEIENTMLLIFTGVSSLITRNGNEMRPTKRDAMLLERR